MNDITIPIWLLILPCVVWSMCSIFVYSILSETFEENKYVGLVLWGSYLWPIGLLYYLIWAIMNKDYE